MLNSRKVKLNLLTACLNNPFLFHDSKFLHEIRFNCRQHCTLKFGPLFMFDTCNITSLNAGNCTSFILYYFLNSFKIKSYLMTLVHKEKA